MGKALFIVIAFLLVGGYLISLNYDLGDEEGKKGFFSSLWSWLKDLFGNIKDLTGLAVEQEWLPDLNDTNSTEVKDAQET